MTSNTMAMPLATGAGSPDSYFRSVQSIPMLSAEEECALAESYREKGDLEAARKLVMSHLRFVIKVARGYNGYGLAQSDLIQEGSIGLMKAVKRFDPSVGVRLVSFAVYWIRAEIHEYILRNWRIVKIATTKAQRKLFFKLRSCKKRLAWLNSKEVDSVAQALGVKPQEVLEMEKRLSSHDISFDMPETDDDDTATFAPVSYLEDKGKGPEELLDYIQNNDIKMQGLRTAIDKLDKRSRDIINKRWLVEKRQTLHQLADKYNISAERIRQIEQSALKQIATFITA